MGETDWGGDWVLFWWTGPSQLIFNPIFCWRAGLCSLAAVWPGTKLWWRWWRQWWPPSKGPMQALLHSVAQPCSRPSPTHASAGDSWTLTASLGQSLVGPLLLSPGSWCPWESPEDCPLINDLNSYLKVFTGDKVQLFTLVMLLFPSLKYKV